MRVVLNGHIVELRAKACEEGKFTKTDTMNVMNWLSASLREAAMYNSTIGAYVYAEHLNDDADALFEKLKKNGYYDDVKQPHLQS